MENGDPLHAICKLKAPLLAYLFAKDKEANITTTVAQSNVLDDPGRGKRTKKPMVLYHRVRHSQMVRGSVFVQARAETAEL